MVAVATPEEPPDDAFRRALGQFMDDFRRKHGLPPDRPLPSRDGKPPRIWLGDRWAEVHVLCRRADGPWADSVTNKPKASWRDLGPSLFDS